MKHLHISSTLSLPLSFTTVTQAILAKKRVGKSYTASVQAEELLKLKQQIVVIDITGAWHGLRSSEDGRKAGYPILVAGGERGDIPLEESAGEVMAEAIVADKFSCILDVSHFRKAQTHRFLAPFLETLYRKNRTAMHIFCDEADFYAPQKGFGEELRTLGAMSDLVRRGGIRGIGCTLITQRPAVLNKDVLTQCEILTCLRIVHHRDIAAIKEWIDVHGDPEQAKQMIKDLPSLPIGTAWIWAPAFPDENGIFQKVKIRRRETFDSGATPKPGQNKRKAKVLAAVDVKRLGNAIAATVERVKENDPKELQKKIKVLEAELKARDQLITVQGQKIDKLQPMKLNPAYEKADHKGFIRLYEGRPIVVNPAKPDSEMQRLRRTTNGIHLPPGEKAILTACIQFPEGRDRAQLSVITGYKRSSRDAYIFRLREKGLVETDHDLVTATDAGYQALPDFQPLPTGDALQEYWSKELPEGERAVLELLIKHYPQSVEKNLIDTATGYKRSSRDAYLFRLRAKQLVQDDQRGKAVRASDNLFE